MENSVVANNGKVLTGSEVTRKNHEGEDSEEDEDEERDEPVTVTTSVADSCSASHEFEWLSPSCQSASCSHIFKQTEQSSFLEASLDKQQTGALEENGVASCHVSPSRSQNRTKHPSHTWSRKASELTDQARMSPSPCHEILGYRRHLSPIRSSWCCPSSPHPVCMHHHGGSMLSGLELVSYNRECFGHDMPFWSCINCSCLPPTGLTPQSRYESHTWCQNSSPHHEIHRRESSSPCSLHKSCQVPGSRRSRSISVRKRDSSPLSPQYSPVPGDQPHLRHSGHEQWQIPTHSEDIEGLHKVQELESDKKNLLLQASVLADQVEAQADKIVELERLLHQKKDELMQLEQNLHQEMLAHSAVENNKLELMSELSNLRLRLTAAERDRKQSDDKCRKLEHELALLKVRLFEKETEHTVLKEKYPWNDNHSVSNSNSEVDKLKCTLDSLMISTEKDFKLEDLQSSLTKYKKLQDIVLSSHSHSQKASSSDICIMNQESSTKSDSLKKKPNSSNIKPHTSHVISSVSTCGQASQPLASFSIKNSPFDNSNQAFHKSSSVENISSNKVFPEKNLYGTMPRPSGTQTYNHVQSQLQELDAEKATTQNAAIKSSEQSPVSTIKDETKSRSINGTNNKSFGVSFAEECVTIPQENSSHHISDMSQLPAHNFFKSDKGKNKGLLKFFSKQDFVIFKKWKHTGTQNIERVEGDFKRGGIRATAGPRLGWSRDIKNDPDIPFSCWNNDMIVEWLHKLGLSMYITDCKKWMCTGEMLIKATSHDLEKELNMKHPLHKKKFLLAIRSMNSCLTNLPSAVNKIDCDWVFRWLDDIGLPQYKDSFTEALVDGRMLHSLTVEDLLHLKVTSQLHHISIKRGIQILREKGFDPHCLVRRSLPDESRVYTPDMVALWTNHRVMEWLRTVDLSEYAPNLRGSGVHGALIVYEPKFNTNLFATLLNIPPTKTLLRRHLATHFRHIVGEELMHVKREHENEVPISPSVKVKVIKKNQFALIKKRNKLDNENEEYVCPMDIPVTFDQSNQVQKSSEGEKLIVRRNSDPSPQERNVNTQRESDEVGAVSKEISNLTSILQNESLKSAPSTVV